MKCKPNCTWKPTDCLLPAQSYHDLYYIAAHLLHTRTCSTCSATHAVEVFVNNYHHHLSLLLLLLSMLYPSPLLHPYRHLNPSLLHMHAHMFIPSADTISGFTTRVQHGAESSSGASEVCTALAHNVHHEYTYSSVGSGHV